jgi:hypothetical protein
MFPVPFSRVVVAVNGEQPQRYDHKTETAHEFAAMLYGCVFRESLGKYAGTESLANGCRDRFTGGTITN